MKQVIQNMSDGKTTVSEVPVPMTKVGMVLVQTAASVVSSGTERMVVEFAEKSLLEKARARPDLARQLLDKARREGLVTAVEAARNRLDQPMTLGYASSGRVVEVGEGLVGFQVGDRVACAGGGYAVHAEYNLVPKNLVVKLPEQVDFESGAFATLGAIALHGFHLSEARLGESVAVIGLGLLGLLEAQIARSAGCKVFGIELDQKRLELANGMGIPTSQRQFAEEAASSFTSGQGFDAVIICADTPEADPVELAGAIAHDRANVVALGAVGQNLPRKIYYEKELKFVNSRSYGPGRYDTEYEENGHDYPIGYVRWTIERNMAAFLELVAGGKVQVQSLITHRFPIEQAVEAYEIITGKRGEPFVGVVLTYSQPDKTDGLGERLLEKERVIVGETFEGKGTGFRIADSVQLGVFGAGNFANSITLPILKKLPSVHLIGMCSASGMSTQHAAERFGFSYATTDENQILTDAQIDTVAILTRHDVHARQIKSALRAGKHVFCEKPLAIDEKDIDEIEALLRQVSTPEAESQVNSPIFCLGLNRRFSPMIRSMADFLSKRNEALVANYRVNAGYIPQSHWVQDEKQGGGRIIGEACHFIDVLTYLVGSPPISVSGIGLPDNGRYHEDNVILDFTFSDGSIGSLTYTANGDKSFSKERLEVFCGGRIAVLNDFRRLKLIHNGKKRVFRAWFNQDKGHQAIWTAFNEAVRSGKQPPIPYAHIMGVSRATFAAVRALREKRIVQI